VKSLLYVLYILVQTIEKKNMPFTAYIRNLNFQTTDEALKNAFEAHGEVEAVKIPIDKYRKRPRGFGFVTFTDESALEAAIEKMNNTELDGRTIQVQKAKPQTNKGPHKGKKPYNKSKNHNNPGNQQGPYEQNQHWAN